MESTVDYRKEQYELVGKEYHPSEGEILYKFDDCLDIPPLGVKITKWGSKNHGSDDGYLIEGENIYPQEVLDKWKEKYGKRKFKKMMRDNPKTSWFYLPELYKKV